MTDSLSPELAGPAIGLFEMGGDAFHYSLLIPNGHEIEMLDYPELISSTPYGSPIHNWTGVMLVQQGGLSKRSAKFSFIKYSLVVLIACLGVWLSLRFKRSADLKALSLILITGFLIESSSCSRVQQVESSPVDVESKSSPFNSEGLLEALPGMIDFGLLQLGETHSRTVAILNHAPSAFVIDKAHSSCSCAVLRADGVVIPAESTVEFSVEWRPTERGASSKGVLISGVFLDKSLGGGEVEVLLKGEARPEMEMEPKTLRNLHSDTPRQFSVRHHVGSGVVPPGIHSVTYSGPFNVNFIERRQVRMDEAEDVYLDDFEVSIDSSAKSNSTIGSVTLKFGLQGALKSVSLPIHLARQGK